VTASAPAAVRAGVSGLTREKTGPNARALAFADFHIHTRFSRDSILSEDKFIRVALERGLTHVAITNHNNVEGAISVRDRVAELDVDDRLTVILGEEVSTADGELVGVFLQRTIPRGLSAEETADEIHAQGGLVSVPHPFDPFRAAHIRLDPLVRLAETGRVDMLEVFNSRVTFQRHNQEAAEFAARYEIPGIAASDSHSSLEVAMSFNAMPAFESAEELNAALALNEWHGSRSTVLIHVTTRYAVWSNVIGRWRGRQTAAETLLGPEPPRHVRAEPIEAPAPEELPKSGDPEASSDEG
jgi:predicted metal-dependent phosphoesterase TrpH